MLLAFDTSNEQSGARVVQAVRGWRKARVNAIVFTHGHVDHAFGLQAFLLPGQKPPRIIAHRAVKGRFARYERTRRHNAALNALAAVATE